MKKIALAPAVLALGAYILSPAFYNQLPDKYAHIVYIIAVAVSTLLPELFPKKP